MDPIIGGTVKTHYGLEIGSGELLWTSAIVLPSLFGHIISSGWLSSSLKALVFSASVCTAYQCKCKLRLSSIFSFLKSLFNFGCMSIFIPISDHGDGGQITYEFLGTKGEYYFE